LKFEPKIEIIDDEDEDAGGIRDKAKAVSAIFILIMKVRSFI